MARKRERKKRRLVWVSWRKATGWWHVRETGVGDLDTFVRKADAVDLAVRYCNAEASDGSWLSLRIKRRDGQIEARGERTYPRSSDPSPPKG